MNSSRLHSNGQAGTRRARESSPWEARKYFAWLGTSHRAGAIRDEAKPDGDPDTGAKRCWKKTARRHRPVRTPTLLQMEAAECGAAALGIVLEYHGRYVPLEVLRDDCAVSRDGSNAYYLKEAAQYHGLTVTGLAANARSLAQQRPPLVVFWQMNHFVVVEGFARGKVYLNDPATGRQVVSEEEFARSYSGVSLLCQPGPKFKREGRRPSVIAGLAQAADHVTCCAGLRGPRRIGVSGPEHHFGRAAARVH